MKKEYESLVLYLQLFASKPDYKKQSDKSLNKSIEALRLRVDEHKAKMEFPEKYTDGWHDRDERYRAGLIRHWQKEIDNFERQIEDMERELHERGLHSEQ